MSLEGQKDNAGLAQNGAFARFERSSEGKPDSKESMGYCSGGKPDEAAILSDLARVKAVFPLRAIAAVITGRPV